MNIPPVLMHSKDRFLSRNAFNFFISIIKKANLYKRTLDKWNKLEIVWKSCTENFLYNFICIFHRYFNFIIINFTLIHSGKKFCSNIPKWLNFTIGYNFERWNWQFTFSALPESWRGIFQRLSSSWRIVSEAKRIGCKDFVGYTTR